MFDLCLMIDGEVVHQIIGMANQVPDLSSVQYETLNFRFEWFRTDWTWDWLYWQELDLDRDNRTQHLVSVRSVDTVSAEERIGWCKWVMSVVELHAVAHCVELGNLSDCQLYVCLKMCVFYRYLMKLIYFKLCSPCLSCCFRWRWK